MADLIRSPKVTDEMTITLDAWNDLAERAERQKAEIERLRAALQAIDGINDNPACFRIDIDQIIRRALEGK